MSRVAGLRVLARSTVFRFNQHRLVTNAPAVGRQLGVGAVLTGQLVSRSNVFELRFELVRSGDGSLIWGDSWRRSHSGLQGAEKDLAQGIARRMHVPLSAADDQRLGRPDTVDPEAYRWYLEGRHHLALRTRESGALAEARFRQAVAKDPDFALAYLGLAEAVGLRVVFDPHETSEVRRLAEKVLELDPASGQAHAILGMLARYQWDWEGAERHFIKATTLSPGGERGWHWYGLLLNILGRPQEAEAALRRALDLDPLVPGIRWGLVLVVLNRGDLAEGRRLAQELKQLAPGHVTSVYAEYVVLMCEGRTEEALGLVRAAAERFPNDPSLRFCAGFSLGTLGRREEALEIARAIESMGMRDLGYYHAAAIHAALEDWDRVFDLLEKAVEARQDMVTEATFHPLGRAVRSHPRYARLLEMLRLPQNPPSNPGP